MEEKIKEYHSIKKDPVFKAVFKDKILMQLLIKECLKKKVEILEINSVEMPKDYYKEHGKILDVIVKAEGKIINVEVNNGYSKEKKNRNFAYLCKVHASALKEKAEYQSQAESIQINLNYAQKRDKSYNNKPYKDEFIMYSPKTQRSYGVRFKILDVFVDKYKNDWYNKNIKEVKENPILTAIAIDDKKELEEYANYMNDENIRRLRDKVISINDANIFGSEESYYDRIRNEGYYNGKESGILKGLRKGKKEAKEEMAKSFLKLNKLSLEDISLCTGLSLTKLKKLKEDISK